jgi:hypothetical protein
MQNYTIDTFWAHRLQNAKVAKPNILPGWHTDVKAMPTFVEAPLSRSENFGNNDDPGKSEIILVSAPGAVGKSTLARQIASLTGAVYLDLAEAEPVGGNTLSGGLVKTGILTAWQSGAAGLLIDGLDEARLKVTQEGFEAFLADVAYISRRRSTPTILFGRTGAIQDAWLVLSDKISVTVLEIGYYTPSVALDFAKARLKVTNPNNPHLETGYRALEILLGRLRENTQEDGDRFAGYAPVLQAVANHVARETNPSTLISKAEKGEQPVTLQNVVEAILEREHQKLQALTFEDTDLTSKLYRPTEQLQRLVARVYKRPAPPLPTMNPKDAQTYSAALETWVPEHPFLDGNFNAASAVFGAVIVAAALRDTSTTEAASLQELAKGAAANPFLAEFYFGGKSGRNLPPEHIGIIYASLRARLSLGDSASLTVDGIEEGDELEQLHAEVEIAIVRFGDEQVRVLRFDSDQAGSLRLGSHIEDVDISAPLATVEIGGAREAVLVGPVNIQCQKLKFAAERLIIEKSQAMPDSAVMLEADVADAGTVISVPVLNGQVALTVAWPDAEAYPWTSFRGSPTAVQDPRAEEALRRFRKFVISFRSHSKGSLKRLAAKLEHERMTKGTGKAVLGHIVATGILTTDGSMYTLHQAALAERTGASYTSAMARDFSEQTIAFITEAIATLMK